MAGAGQHSIRQYEQSQRGILQRYCGCVWRDGRAQLLRGSTNFTTDPFNCTGSSGTAWTAIFTRTVDFVPVNAYWTFEDLSYQFHTSDAANFTGKYRWVITNSSGSETLGTEAAFTYSDVTDGVFGSPITQFGMAGLGAKTGTVVLTLEIQRTLGSNNVTSAGGTNGAGVLTSNLVVNAKTQG
jgi:hypothetical protein